MFDFPANPNVGDASNGYVYNGTGWAGGPVATTPTPTTTFVNLAGLTVADIDVPAWAKMATLECAFWPAAVGSYSFLQFSVDGTTFYAGTSYQLIGGVSHNVVGGYTTQTAGAAGGIYLDYPRSNLSIPHLVNCFVNLECLNTSQLFTARSESQAYDNAALGFQNIWQGYLNTGIAGRLKKLRIAVQAGGAWPNNSYAKVTWHGDVPAPPQSNAVGEVPSDNVIYRRRNGVWIPPQPGDVIGASYGEYASYGSGSTSAVLLMTINHVVRQAGSRLVAQAYLNTCVSVASATTYLSVNVAGTSRMAYTTQGNVAGGFGAIHCQASGLHGLAAGATAQVLVYGYCSGGTVYWNGYQSGSYAPGQTSNCFVREIAV